MVKEVVVLGATGSIGTSTLDVVRALKGRFRVAAVTAYRNWERLAEIAREFNPRVVVIGDRALEPSLKERLGSFPGEVLSGEKGLLAAAALDEGDVVITGIAGSTGLAATVEAVKAGKRVGAANKEPFVMAGGLIRRLAEESGCEIIPVDSEHSAIFQCLLGERFEEVSKVYITASGGPFRGWPPERLASVTPEEALNHPTWDMGAKITIDSATLMNKALELLEARHLFSLAPSQLDVLIHPQSIVHSLVAFRDGNVKAQLGLPDMSLPIQYALTFPERAEGGRSLDLAEVGTLTFEKADPAAYPALRIGRRLLESENDAPGTVVNAANEEAVHMFLSGEIPFTEIVPAVERAMEEFGEEHVATLEDISLLDERVRHFVKGLHR